jgi:hypothetical protein
MKKKCYVLMVNLQFEKAILDGIKTHSIRKNYPFWEKRIKKIQAGEGYLSLRCWTGKPRRSKQREFLRLKNVGIQAIRIYHHETIYGDKMPPNFCVRGKDIDKDILAKNDGFYDVDGDPNTDDFIDWFYDYPDGVMALIHFTEFRYGRD